MFTRGFLQIIIGLAFIAALSAATAAMAQNSDFVISGTSDVSTSTGVIVEAGQTLQISATGLANYGYEGTCSCFPSTFPDGSRLDGDVDLGPKFASSAVLPSAPIGALIGRIGTSGPWFLVGADHSSVTPSSGELQLLYNDTDHSDNSGSYTAAMVEPTETIPVTGRKITVTDFAGLPNRRRLAVISNDPEILAPAPGGTGDPTVAGAIFRLVNLGTGEEARVDLPASGWRLYSTGAYRYRGPSSGGCNTAIVADGLIRAKCRGIDFTLDEAEQESLTVTLQLGSSTLYCLHFGGRVRNDAGIGQARRAGRGKFLSRDAPVPPLSVCPLPATETPSPPPATGVLRDGVHESGLAADLDQELHFLMEVSEEVDQVQFQITGGSGDADLYVKLGSQPTTESYDCHVAAEDNNETCGFHLPTPGTWYVMLRAYAPFSGVTLVGTTAGSDDPSPPPEGGYVPGLGICIGVPGKDFWCHDNSNYVCEEEAFKEAWGIRNLAEKQAALQEEEGRAEYDRIMYQELPGALKGRYAEIWGERNEGCYDLEHWNDAYWGIMHSNYYCVDGAWQSDNWNQHYWGARHSGASDAEIRAHYAWTWGQCYAEIDRQRKNAEDRCNAAKWNLEHWGAISDDIEAEHLDRARKFKDSKDAEAFRIKEEGLRRYHQILDSACKEAGSPENPEDPGNEGPTIVTFENLRNESLYVHVLIQDEYTLFQCGDMGTPDVLSTGATSVPFEVPAGQYGWFRFSTDSDPCIENFVVYKPEMCGPTPCTQNGFIKGGLGLSELFVIQ